MKEGRGEDEPMLKSLDLPSSYGQKLCVRFLYKIRIVCTRMHWRRPANKVVLSGTDTAGELARRKEFKDVEFRPISRRLVLGGKRLLNVVDG